jgi:hypothetical protein
VTSAAFRRKRRCRWCASRSAKRAWAARPTWRATRRAGRAGRPAGHRRRRRGGRRSGALLEGGGIRSYLKRDEAISTIIKLRVIGRQQQMVRIDFEEAPTDTVLRDKLEQFKALLADYDVIVLSDYAKGSLVAVADMIAAPARPARW